jgi:hypothetical protein
MNKQFNLIILISALLLVSATITFGQDKLGKIYVKAATTEVDGQQIPDAELEEAVKDIKKRPGKFILADKESEANFLLVVTERISIPQSGTAAAKSILATLYIRKSDEWEPATKLKSGSNDIFWGIAAEHLIKNAAKWVKENIKN